MTPSPQLSQMVVSKNRLEGSLADTPLKELLAACHKHLVTGAVKIWDDKGRSGVLTLRAGAVDQARFGDSVGDAAVDAMRALGDGTYELAQQLPDLTGDLGRAAALEGSTGEVDVVKIMQHCEKNALSCVITVVHDFDRGEIHYKAGELVRVTLNGTVDDDAIVTMLSWPEARYRVSAPPLASDIQGWPKVGREQTQPFKIDAALLPPQMLAAHKRHEEKLAKLPRPRTDEGFAKGTGEVEKVEATAKAAPARAMSKPPVAAPPFVAETPARRSAGLSTTLVQAFLLTLAATLALTLVALLATQ
jgi:hypothetical protein